MQLIVEVPDDSPLVQEIESWQDGAAYDLNVTQTGTGAFALVDAGAAMEEEVVEEEVAPVEPVAALIAAKRAKP